MIDLGTNEDEKASRLSLAMWTQVVITPLMESEMVGAMTWVDTVETWEDSGANRWEHRLRRWVICWGNLPAAIEA